MKQPSVCISPLDWGLGHATRCIPLIQGFEKLGYKVFIATNGYQEEILKEATPNAVFLKLKGYGVHYTKRENLLLFSLLLQLPKIIYCIIREYFWLKNAQKKYQFDLVVADNRFGFFHKKVKSVFITHQLNLQTPYNWTSNLYQLVLHSWLNNFDTCWIPDIQSAHNLSGILTRSKHMPSIPLWYMGSLSRLHKELVNNVETEIEFLGIVSGPEPQRTLFENQLWAAGNALGLPFVMVAGLPTQKLYNKITPNGALYHHLSGAELAKQIQRAKYIICRGGYTSLMELIPFHKKLILIPTPGQTEQIYLAKYWSENGWAVSYDSSNFNLESALFKANATTTSWPDNIEFSIEQLASTLKTLTL